MDIESQERLNEQFRSAIISEDLKTADLLLKSGADINTKSDKGYSSLFLATFNNKKKSFAYLIDRGIDVNLQDNNGETIVLNLIRQKKQAFLDYLLKTKGSEINFELKDQYSRTPLIMAAIEKDSETIKKMFEINPNINVHARTEQKSTAILIASSNYDIKTLKILMENGANIHDVDYYEKNCLINAIMNVVKEPAKENANPNMFGMGQDDGSNQSSGAEDIKDKMTGDYLETIQFLIDNGIDVNYKAASGMTALFASCYYDLTGNAAISLLENGANPKILHSQMTTDKISPLGVAFETGKVALASKLLEYFSDEEKIEWMNKPNSEGNTPAALGFVHQKLRQLAIDNFADPNAVLNIQGQKMPVLAYIINSSDADTFEKMVSAGAVLTYKDKPEFEMYEPLKLAISSGSPAILDKIIHYPGVDLNAELKIAKEFSTTPLSFLMTNSQSKMLETLMSHKRAAESMLNQKMGDGSNAYKLPEETRQQLKQELDRLKSLEEKLKENRGLMIDLLLDNGAKINEQDHNGRTALFYITEDEYIDVLINKGADFFITDNEGNNPLSFAIKNNLPIAKKWLEFVIENNHVSHPQIQNLLIDIMYTSSNAYLAQNNLRSGIINSISNGSSLLNKQDADGNTPLIIASALKQAPIASVLVDLGADVNMSNKLGETAIMHAIAKKDVDLVKFLVEKGADLKAKAKNKKSVMDFAEEVNDKEIIAAIYNKLNPGKTYSTGKMRIN